MHPPFLVLSILVLRKCASSEGMKREYFGVRALCRFTTPRSPKISPLGSLAVPITVTHFASAAGFAETASTAIRIHAPVSGLPPLFPCSFPQDMVVCAVLSQLASTAEWDRNPRSSRRTSLSATVPRSAGMNTCAESTLPAGFFITLCGAIFSALNQAKLRKCKRPQPVLSTAMAAYFRTRRTHP